MLPALHYDTSWVANFPFHAIIGKKVWCHNTITSYFEAICYSSISKRPVFCGWYESFSSFRKSPEYLDLEQMKFKDSILYKFKATPPFPQYFNTALWLANNNLKNLLWFSAIDVINTQLCTQIMNKTALLIGCIIWSSDLLTNWKLRYKAISCEFL